MATVGREMKGSLIPLKSSSGSGVRVKGKWKARAGVVLHIGGLSLSRLWSYSVRGGTV